MALEAVVDDLESVAEPFRTEYEKGQDGKFYLNLNNGDALPFVAGLRTSLQSERGRAGQFEKQIKDWKALGKSPAEIQEMIVAAETAAQEAARKAGDFDGILKQHQDKWQEERNALSTQRDSALSIARRAVVDSGLKSALVNAKATAEGLALLPKILGERVNTEFEGDEFKFTVLAADGRTPLVGANGGTGSFDDLVKEAMKNFPSLFEGSGAGGGGKPTKDGGGSANKTISRSEFEKLSNDERFAVVRSGVTITD